MTKGVVRDFARVYANCYITDNKLPPSNVNQEAIIDEGAVLTIGCVVVAGVRIGIGSFVGANTTVTKNVPDGIALVGGVMKPVTDLRWLSVQYPWTGYYRDGYPESAWPRIEALHQRIMAAMPERVTLVSVVIPTYNRPEQLLNRALPSVFDQRVDDQEILVIGDGTDSETEAGVRELMKAHDNLWFWNLPHFPYPEEHEKAWGLYGLEAINFGLDRAQGEWIAVLGDDDEFLPNHHSDLLIAAAKTGADHVYGISAAYKNGQFIGQEYGAWPPGDAQLANGANLWRRSLGYRFALDCWDRGKTGDADMWTRMYADGVKFHFEPVLVHKYHRGWP